MARLKGAGCRIQKGPPEEVARRIAASKLEQRAAIDAFEAKAKAAEGATPTNTAAAKPILFECKRSSPRRLALVKNKHWSKASVDELTGMPNYGKAMSIYYGDEVESGSVSLSPSPTKRKRRRAPCSKISSGAPREKTNDIRMKMQQKSESEEEQVDDDGNEPEPVFEMSAYEADRLATIERNNAFLASLGISEIIPKRNTHKDRNPHRKKLFNQQPTRVSQRMRGAPPQHSEGILGADYRRRRGDLGSGTHGVVAEVEAEAEVWNFSISESATKQRVDPQALFSFIEQENSDHFERVSAQQVSHCVMRLNSMSVKAFASRTKTIARAKGSMCGEKLLLAHYAVRLAKVPELVRATRLALKAVGVEVPHRATEEQEEEQEE
jgi:hypothetical protein